MIVTVQETINHSGDITAEMVNAYMRRRGWRPYDDDTRVLYIGDAERPVGLVPWFRDPTLRSLACTISAISEYENRSPSEVLADIAEGR